MIGYDDWKLQTPEDEEFYRSERGRLTRPLRCIGCGEVCDGLLCDACADEREEEASRA